MKLSRLAFAAAIAASLMGSSADAQVRDAKATTYRSTGYSNYYSQSPSDQAPAEAKDDEEEGDSTPAPIVSGSNKSAPKVDSSMRQLAPAACSSNCDVGTGKISCDDACDAAGSDQWKLFQCPVLGFNVGGWSAVGYHTANSNFNFNNHADRVQLQQQWLYAERIADGSEGVGLGGRIDYVYGTDAPDTQAFGVNNRHWDNSWDNGGAYGHSIPQLYGEVAVGDLSVKFGHFFTIVGNEVVQATGNFFYSRQFTFYNAEPFTHTGLLSTYKVDDETLFWNGYVMGWDSGFEDNGDAFISGFKRSLTDSTSLVYTNVLGRFNDDRASANFGERGQVHSAILTTTLTDRLTHIYQMDYLQTRNGNRDVVRNTFGAINYFIYSLNEKWSLGSRSEWFNLTNANVHNVDNYNQTFGVNYKPNANLTFRPEVRWVWDKERFGYNEISRNDGLRMQSQASFGSDMIFVF